MIFLEENHDYLELFFVPVAPITEIIVQVSVYTF